MNMRYVFLCAFLMHAPAVCVQEEQTPQQEHATHLSQAQPRQNILNSFSRFLRIFIDILSNEKLHTNVKMIEKLFASMLETGYQIIQSTKPSVAKRVLGDHDLWIADLADIVSKEAKTVHIDRKAPHAGMDDETKEIVANFAGVVDNFFKIVADPENPETVPAHILGMLAGMVNIGTIAMTKSEAPHEADYHQLKAYAEQLDDELKQNMLRIILSTRDRMKLATA